MFIVKIFRGGTRHPEQIEFYSNPTPVVIQTDNGPIRNQVEIMVDNVVDLIDIHEGDVVFIENAEGVTIHSIR